MSELDKYLKEVRARVESATPGPWDVSPTTHAVLRANEPAFLNNRICETGSPFERYPPKEACHNNMKLIASAPTDLTKLVKICEVLREGLSWYAGHDPEKESAYFRAGLWRNARNTLKQAEELCKQKEP